MQGKRFGHSCIVILIRIIVFFFRCLTVSLSGSFSQSHPVCGAGEQLPTGEFKKSTPGNG